MAEVNGTLKGIILAGGTGSRLYPLTRITNKHLLPVWDKPMVSYAVEALTGSGIDDIMLVTGGNHAGEFLRLLSGGHEHGARISYAYQENADGIAGALCLAERFAGASPVVVMLADNIFEWSIAPAIAEFAAAPAGARVLLADIDDEERLKHMGVAVFTDGLITRIAEKPAVPQSHSAVTGVYCYDSSVFRVIRGLEPSARGELEITDVNNWYAYHGALEASTARGFWGDAGESVSSYYEVIDFVRARGANKKQV